MKTTFFPLTKLALIASAVIGSAHASTVTLYDNTSSAVARYDFIAAPDLGNGPLYQSFFSGSTASTLDSIELSLVANGGEDDVVIGLYADAANSYGSPIGAIGEIYDRIVSPAGLNIVTLNAHPSLTANSRYWIGLLGPLNDEVAWKRAPDDTGTGVAGGYYYNAGGGYQANSTPGNNPYIMKVTATTVVPEPTTTASLVGLVCLGAGVWLRQRRAA